jgi:hypothetical protein
MLKDIGWAEIELEQQEDQKNDQDNPDNPNFHGLGKTFSTLLG